MKLYYYKGHNFGDMLNGWLWSRLFPKPFDQCFDDETLFIGIGTILNERVPEFPRKKAVFGAGFGYGNLPRVSNRWRFFSVRGRLTASALGLDSRLAVGDPGVFVREFYGTGEPMNGVCFMPHYASAALGNWHAVCNAAGVGYVDPGATVEESISAIRGAKLLVTEAMHGAIIADALRVPWIPVKTRASILEFKWRDWASSLDLEVGFRYLPPIYRRGLKGVVSRASRPITALLLRQIGRQGRGYLSSEQNFSRMYRGVTSALAGMIKEM